MSRLARLRAFVLLGALLLFGMEPLVGRLLLPSSGGGFHVWAACLLFFQGALFLGYLYTHLLSKWVGRGHLLCVLLPVAFLPIGRFLRDLDPNPSSPTGSILGALTISIAIPFVLLSTTGVIAQRWLAESDLPERDNPYQLYAASNAGSFVALLAYPLVVEPLLGLGAQRIVWSCAYAVYAALAFSLVPRAQGGATSARASDALASPAHAADLGAPPPGPATPATSEPPDTGQVESATAAAAAPSDPETPDAPALEGEAETSTAELTPGLLVAWLVLAAVPSACLVAVTNVIATDLGSLPLVWVIPLCIYLLSFVLTFGPSARYPAFVRRFTPEILVTGLVLWGLGGHFTWLAGLGHLGVLGWVCWVGHGELYRARPNPRHLTTFYLCVSLGGWVGGFLVTFVAPRAFTGLWEYPLALGALGLTLALLRRRQILAYLSRASSLGVGASVVLSGLALVYLGVDLALVDTRPTAYRNEYGIYKVGEIPLTSYKGKRVRIAGKPAQLRAMSHGTIIHGKEIVQIPGFPIGYYHPRSPMGTALKLKPSPAKVAIVGLGAGAQACNLRLGDELTFYELDPDVEVLARRHFSYLERASATILPTRTGDARLELSKDPPQSYDVILVDAFSSDSIPIHLLTAEALELYRSRLKPGGWLILHISSRYYDLRPVIRATAASLSPPLAGVVRETIHEDPVVLARRYEDPSSVYVLARQEAELSPLVEAGFDPQEKLQLPSLAPWSDDYANVLGALWARQRRED